MSTTLNKNFTFATSTTEGWSISFEEGPTPGFRHTGSSLSVLSDQGFSAPPSLYANYSTHNYDGTPGVITELFYLVAELSPANLGIPVGSKIESIEFVSLAYNCVGTNSLSGLTIGHLDIFAGGVVVLDGSTATMDRTGSGGWMSKVGTGGVVAGTSLGQYQTLSPSGNSTLRIRLDATWDTTAHTSAQILTYIDDIKYNIVYTLPTYTSNVSINKSHQAISSSVEFDGPYMEIVDDSDGSPSFVATGGFAQADPNDTAGFHYVGYNNSQYVSYFAADAGTATYLFGSTPTGQYDFWATWTGSGSSGIIYSVFDNDSLLEDITVNQADPPTPNPDNPDNPYTYDLAADGTYWRSLGSFFVSGGSTKVVIQGDPSKVVIADAIRVSWAEPPTTGSSTLEVTKTLDGAGEAYFYLNGDASLSTPRSMNSSGDFSMPIYESSVSITKHKQIASTVSYLEGSYSQLEKNSQISSDGFFDSRLIKGSATGFFMRGMESTQSGTQFVMPNITPPLSVSSLGFFIRSSGTDEALIGSPTYLSMHGHSPLQGSSPLIIKVADPSNRMLNLFIAGPRPGSGSMPMYLKGPNQTTGRMNLVLMAPPAPTLSSSCPLYVGSEVSPRSALPLSLSGWNAPVVSDLNLSVDGADRVTITSLLNLSVRGGNPQTNAIVGLYLKSEMPTRNFLDLYIEGLGTSAGYYPGSSSMNMHVARGPQSGIYLNIQNNQSAGSMPLYLVGSPMEHGQVVLYIKGDGGVINSSVDLSIAYTYEPQQVTGSLGLLIPYTSGIVTGSSPLYINGWRNT